MTLTFFVITLRPDVGGTEDSPKFQFVGRVLGTSHSPGYPFYAMATWAFGRLPIGTLAYRINLFSAVCGALACVCIFLTARRLGVTTLLSIAAALAAATSYPVWSNSVTAEVYTLAAVLSGFAVYWLIAFAQTSASLASELRRVRRGLGRRGAWRLYAACAMWACGFGNHLTIVGILPAAVIYGIVKDRAVLRPRVAITAAIIGLIGVAQYWFIAIRTMQGAPYLEARADDDHGRLRRDHRARRVVGALLPGAKHGRGDRSADAAERHPHPHGHDSDHARRPSRSSSASGRSNAEVLLIFGAAAGTLGMIANLWGDVVGFITPVCVQLWPLAALGLAMLVMAGQQASKPRSATALTAAGVVAMIVPVAQLRSATDRDRARCAAPAKDPVCGRCTRSCRRARRIVAENYWLARLVNYMHFSGEFQPDPNPRVLDSDINDVKTAVADGLEVYAFEGATQWLNAQGLRFEQNRRGAPAVRDLARDPAARHPHRRGQRRAPAADRMAAGRRSRADAARARQLRRLRVDRRRHQRERGTAGFAGARSITRVGAEGRVLTILSSDDGPQIVWGDDVLTAIDRGLAVAAFSPAGHLIGQWAFALDDKPGVQLPPTPFVLRGEAPCQVLRPGVRNGRQRRARRWRMVGHRRRERTRPRSRSQRSTPRPPGGIASGTAAGRRRSIRNDRA